MVTYGPHQMLTGAYHPREGMHAQASTLCVCVPLNLRSSFLTLAEMRTVAWYTNRLHAIAFVAITMFNNLYEVIISVVSSYARVTHARCGANWGAADLHT